MPAQAVRDDRLQDRTDHGERERSAGRSAGCPRMVNSTTFGMKYWTGVSTAAGRIMQPDEARGRAAGRSGRAGRSSHDRRTGARARTPSPPMVPRRPRSNVFVPYSSSMNRLASTGAVNRPKPIAANARITGLERADLPEPGERRFDRDRRRLLVLDDLAEHVLLLELAAGRFRGDGTRGTRRPRPGCRGGRTASASRRRRRPARRCRRRSPGSGSPTTRPAHRASTR